MPYYNRKYPRLKNFDYGKNGYYFVTICTLNALEWFSVVGWGLAPACDTPDYFVALTDKGQIAKQQLFELEKRFQNLKIDQYIIMPNHIHVIFVIQGEKVGASPHPTICDMVGAYKSLVTRICNEQDNTRGRKIFQRSFYEHIIRNENAYNDICRYIYENPMKGYHEHQIQEE